jgi:hypothetical protein
MQRAIMYVKITNLCCEINVTCSFINTTFCFLIYYYIIQGHFEAIDELTTLRFTETAASPTASPTAKRTRILPMIQHA